MIDKGDEEIEKEKKNYTVFVCIDYVGSTNLIKNVGKKEAERRINFYRDTVDRIFENFKGVGKGWSGEGNFFFFFYSEENKAIEDNAVKAAIRCIAELRTGIDVEILARISIGSGVIEVEKDLGKITSLEISLTGHINSVCPENSILITENIYFGLSEELRSKFKICGTAKRDKVLTFLYPVEKKDKVNKEYFLDEREDYGKDYFEYIRFVESINKTLLVTGVRQIQKIPTLDLEEGFFPLRLEKAEKIPELPKEKIEEEKENIEKIRKIREESAKIFVSFDFIDALKTDKHMVILGDPGSGKTTLLKYISLIYSRGLKKIYEKFGFEEWMLPILVPISAIYALTKNNNKPFVDAICGYFKTQGIENTERFIKENLDKGKCIVLLDGLDEIPKRQERFSVARGIENFIRMYSNNRFIITSRIIGYEKINLDSITEYYVSQLDDNEIKKFVNNWFMAFEKKVKENMPENAIKRIADDEATQLISSINEDENIKDLARNPFLLSLICLVQKSGYKLPRYRVELYRIMSETLFETWVMARNMSGKSLTEARDYKEGEKILAPLALWMHENLPGGIEKEDKLKEKIVEIMKERGIGENEAINSTNKFFEYLAQETQLIIPKGGDYYGFRHLSFEEFLSARALIMKESYEVYLEKYRNDPRWVEVFLLTAGWLGIVDGREEELTRIVKQLMENKNIYDLTLTGRIVAENLGVKKDVGKEVIEKIGEMWLHNGFVSLIEEIMFSEEIMKIFKKTLLREYGKGTYNKFIRTLKDKKENSTVRERATSGLSLFANEDTHIKEIFVEILKDKEESIFVRRKIAIGLSSLVKEDENIKEILLKILKDKKENIVVRGGAVNGLSPLVRIDADIKEIFIEMLKKKEENKYVRGSVAFGLSFLVEKDASIKEILITLLKDRKENEYVRGSVANGLSFLVEKDASIKEIFITVLKDGEENKDVRGMIVFGLLSFVWKGADIKEIFIEILKNKEEDNNVRVGIASGLSSLVKEDKNIKEILLKILKDRKEDNNVRERAANGLSPLVEEDENIKKIFVEILKDKKENTVVRVIIPAYLTPFVLIDIDIKEVFIEILKNKEESEKLRGTVAVGLSLLVEKDKNIKEILLKILKNRKEGELVRAGVASGLSSLVKKDENIKKIFVEILKNKEEDNDVRVEIASGLSSLVEEDKNIKEILIEISKDEMKAKN